MCLLDGGAYGFTYRVLPDELSDSPLLERDADGIPSLFGGVSYRF